MDNQQRGSVVPSGEEQAETIIEVRNVLKTYSRGSERVKVLNALSMVVKRGEFLALMGPSGSGKTTLLNLIAAIDSPDSGAVFVAGKELTALSQRALSKWRVRNVGFIFQFYNLIPVLTAIENTALPLALLPLSRKERTDRAKFALDIVGLSHRLDHFPKQLSGGEEQRVAIARAVVTDPQILVADEPTGDLDRHAATEILMLLRALNRDYDKTIVMVTHDPHAAEYASRVIHLDKGEVTAQ